MSGIQSVQVEQEDDATAFRKWVEQQTATDSQGWMARDKIRSIVIACLDLLVVTGYEANGRATYSGDLMKLGIPERAVWLQAQMLCTTKFGANTYGLHYHRYAALTGISLTVAEIFRYFRSLQEAFICRIFLPETVSTAELEQLKDIPEVHFGALRSGELSSVFRMCKKTTDLLLCKIDIPDLAPFAELQELRTLRLERLSRVPKNIDALFRLPHLTTLYLTFRGRPFDGSELTQDERDGLSVLERIPHPIKFEKKPGHAYCPYQDSSRSRFAQENVHRSNTRLFLANFFGSAEVERLVRTIPWPCHSFAWPCIANEDPLTLLTSLDKILPGGVMRELLSFLSPSVEDLKGWGEVGRAFHHFQLPYIDKLSTENLSYLAKRNALYHTFADQGHSNILCPSNLRELFSLCPKLTSLELDLSVLDKDDAFLIADACASTKKIVELMLVISPKAIYAQTLKAFGSLPLQQLSFVDLSFRDLSWLDNCTSLTTFKCSYPGPKDAVVLQKLTKDGNLKCVEVPWTEDNDFIALQTQLLEKRCRQVGTSTQELRAFWKGLSPEHRRELLKGISGNSPIPPRIIDLCLQRIAQLAAACQGLR